MSTKFKELERLCDLPEKFFRTVPRDASGLQYFTRVRIGTGIGVGTGVGIVFGN